MPFVPLKFKPGVLADDTALASQSGFSAIDKIRFQRGEMQPIGGFSKLTQETFTGIARRAFDWSDLAGDPHLAWGTAAKLYALPGGVITDITPPGFVAGLVDGVGGSGYGSGTYGTGTYGTSSGSVFRAQTWHLDQFGERLLALPTGGALYEWKPDVVQVECVEHGDFASSSGWTTGTGWTIGSGVATKTAGVAANLSRTLNPAPDGGTVYRFTADVTRTAGEAFIRIGVVDVYLDDASAPIPIAATGAVDFLFVAPAGETELNVYGDSSFAGTFDNISITNEIIAYPIEQAPSQSQAMFTDPNGFVVLGGTVEADGDYNAMLLRWSDRGNVRTWVPDTDNLAGEVPLQGGSRIVGMVRSRAQNIVFSDTTVFTMQYTGDPGAPFIATAIATGCGLLGPHAAIDVDGAVFYMSDGQFYACNGQTAIPLECPNRNEVFANLAPGQNDKITAWYNNQFGEIWWHYADARDGVEVSRYVAFNPAEKYWLLGTFDRSAPVARGAFNAPIMFGTADGTIYYHETGASADGNVFEAYAETGAFDIAEGTNLAAIRRFIPDFKDLSVGGLQITISVRGFSQADWRVAYTGMITASTQSLPCRVMGRQLKLRFDWADNNITGRAGHITADVIETGAKR